MTLFNVEKTIYKKKTQYNDITVKQRGHIITLLSPEDIIQSEINLGSPLKPHLEFNLCLLFGLLFCPAPVSILALGLGGGVVPKILNATFPEAGVDVVEIDPEMLKVAEDYFDFQVSSKLRVFIADASDFICRTKNKYDLIVLDTYCGIDLSESVDNQFFFKECVSRLSEKGFLAANLVPLDRVLMDSRLKWLEQETGNVWLLRGITRCNEIVFAGTQPVKKSALIKNARTLKKTLPFNLKTERMMKRLRRWSSA
ncbi:MAG: fused MFS/spermidine synthase [Candidatus Aminicenantes bacterium]|nr:fused MFS/spermidine synthase [Candidatus Aminicenantes bacterium]